MGRVDELFQKSKRFAVGEGLGLSHDRAGNATIFSTAQLIEEAVNRPSAGASTSHPFKVRHVSGDDFKVQAGTCEGQLIATQTIDVGATRPVAILAYPQYDLTIYNGEYVNVIAVKTSPNEPVLVASTSTLSDVDTGITSAGTEARAIIAYIDTGDVIYQIATGNIVGIFADAANGLGQAAGYYNKNF